MNIFLWDWIEWNRRATKWAYFAQAGVLRLPLNLVTIIICVTNLLRIVNWALHSIQGSSTTRPSMTMWQSEQWINGWLVLGVTIISPVVDLEEGERGKTEFVKWSHKLYQQLHCSNYKNICRYILLVLERDRDAYWKRSALHCVGDKRK